jgi:hypothetical protein
MNQPNTHRSDLSARRLIRKVEDVLAAYLNKRIAARLIDDHSFKPRQDGWCEHCDFITYDDWEHDVERCNRPKEHHAVQS